MTSQPWFAGTLSTRSAVGNSRIWRLPRAQLFRCRPHSCQRKVASHSQNTTRSGPHGAVVSTLGDSSAFFGAFFGGRVFSSKWLDHMQKWTPLFFPMSYGMGLMRFRLPPVMTTFRRLPEMIGHGGASGVLMYANPARAIRIVGSTIQLAGRERPYRFLAAVTNLLR